MSNPEKALAQRIRELRRRHFGARGKAAFAERLGLPVPEYERYERGTVPSGELLVRICELTGEDLQWLLTGVAGRGTVVISGTRGRHQDLLARLATLLDDKPKLAAPIEAFVELLTSRERVTAGRRVALPGPRIEDLIPVFALHELPKRLPAGPEKAADVFALARYQDALPGARRSQARFAEPAAHYAERDLRPVDIVAVGDADGRPRQCVCSAALAQSFPGLFGVQLDDDLMQPMFAPGDAALAMIGTEPKVGRPALCRVAQAPEVRCRIWLGEEQGSISLGRVADGKMEHIAREDVLWCVEVFFRLALAA